LSDSIPGGTVYHLGSRRGITGVQEMKAILCPYFRRIRRQRKPDPSCADFLGGSPIGRPRRFRR
jgi:hypothetical protein